MRRVALAVSFLFAMLTLVAVERIQGARADGISGGAVAAGGGGTGVSLQATTPGAAQTGNSNVTGTAIAGTVQGTYTNLYQGGQYVLTTRPACAAPFGYMLLLGDKYGPFVCEAVDSAWHEVVVLSGQPQSGSISVTGGIVVGTGSSNTSYTNVGNSGNITQVIPANSVTAITTTVSVPNAASYDTCMVGLPPTGAGSLSLTCGVTAAGVVTIYATNPTTTSQTLPTASYLVRVFNP